MECEVFCVFLEDKVMYYMCGEFNVIYYYVVFIGSSVRYFSIYRVVVVVKDMF